MLHHWLVAHKLHITESRRADAFKDLDFLAHGVPLNL
jgi:hypothetical protein